MTATARRLLLWHIRELEDLQAALHDKHLAQPVIADKLSELRNA